MGVFKRKYKTKDGLNRESKTWSYEFFISTKRFQGKIDGSFELPEGKTKYTLTKREATRVADTYKDAVIKKLKTPEKHGVLFDDVAYAFYQNYLRKLSARQEKALHKVIRDSYRVNIIALQKYFNGAAFASIQKPEIIAFRNHLRSEGGKDSTINGHVRCLSSMYSYAADEGLVEEDKIPRFSAIKKTLLPMKPRTRYLSEAEYDMLIAQYDELQDTYIARLRKKVVIFNVATGLRKEELLSLRDCDIDTSIRGVNIVQTKNGKDRWIPLSAAAQQQLQQQLQEKKDLRIDSQYVFCKQNGERILDLKKGFKADCERAKIKDVKTHDLRRTFASWQLQGIRCNKKRIEDVSILLGHGSIDITQKSYAFLNTKNIEM